MAEALREEREERAAYDDVRALRFTLVDEQGTVRAALGPGRDGGVGMRLVDARGRARAELALDESGATNLKLHDAEGEVCAWLDVGPDGRPGLYLRGPTGHHEGVRGHAEISVDEHGSPVVSLHDRNGQPRVLMSLDERTGNASLSCADAHGNPSALLTEDADCGHLHLF